MRFFSNFLFLLFIVQSISVFAQPRPINSEQNVALITGKIVDKNQMAVEYANVILYKMPDSIIVGGCVSNDNGIFKLERVANGNYSIRIQFIGFYAKNISNISIKEGKKSVALGTILLLPKNDEIEEVVVTAKKTLIENRLDKKIVNVDPGIAATGGTAVDVLKDVPSVHVDADGGVSIRGSENVTVLIDGRPSTYSSIDQVPATIIDRIEIVTNPSAKYEASGMAGIVNIITKKKIQAGFSGQVQLNAGTNGRYNGNIITNYGVGKVNSYVILDGRRFAAKINGYQTVDDLINEGNLSADTSFSRRRGMMGSVKMGCDIKLNDRNSIGISVFNRQGAFTTKQNTISSTIFNSTLLNRDTSYNNGNTEFNAFDINVTYKWQGKKKDEEFIFSNTLPFNLPTENHTLTQNKTSYIDNTTRNEYEYNPAIELSYSKPLFTNGKIETGASFFFFESKNSSTRISNNVIVDENYVLNKVNKNIYSQFSNSLSKKVLYQIGVRLENIYSSYNELSQIIKNNSTYVYPSAAISYKKNDTVSFTINYSKRVNYPRINLMSPVLSKGDLTNWNKGNPQLIPEFVHSFEFAIAHDYKKVSLNNTVFFRLNMNTFQRKQYVLIDSTEQVGSANREKMVTTVINGSSFQSWGYEHFHSINISKKIKYSLNASLYLTMFADTLISKYFSSQFINGMTKFNVSYNPLKQLEISSSTQYNAPYISMQGGSGHSFSMGGSSGKVAQSWQTDISVKQMFLKGNASFSLRLTDIFATNQFQIDYYRTDAHVIEKRIRNSRSLFVGVMYKINGGIKQRKKQTENLDNDF